MVARMTARGFSEDIASLRRTVLGADPSNRLAVFGALAREIVNYADSGMPKPDLVDALKETAMTFGGLNETDIEAKIGEAFANPFRPAKANGANGATTSHLPPAALVIQQASTITPQEILWLWRHRIAIGKQTILAGEPGLGKSQVTCAVTAIVTTAGLFPNGEGIGPLGSVIILSAEDDAADTIRPRLDAAGADASKVYIVSAVRGEGGKGRRAFNLQADLELLEAEIKRIGDVKLVVIDPVSSYLGKVDSHRNAELRAVLEPIGEMAARLGVAVLSVTHLNKGNGTANNRVIGSIAFVAAARAAFVVCRDPDDNERRLLLPTKNNLGPEGAGIGFRVGTQVTPSGIVAPCIFWDAIPVTITANEALNTSHEYGSAPARNEAEGFLQELLAAGTMPVKQIEAEAKAAGLSWRTVKRAKDTLGIKASKAGLDGGWFWTLPEGGQP